MNETGGRPNPSEQGQQKDAEQEKAKQEEAKRKETEREEEERYAEWMKAHPEKPPEVKRESGPEIEELEGLFASFESEHSLADLLSIIDLTPEEAPNHPIREPAKKALNPIVVKLNKLEKETDISPEKLSELKGRYKHLSRAVGIINKNKVDHDR